MQLALPARVAERSDLHRPAGPNRRVLCRGRMDGHSTFGRRRLSVASSPTQRPVGMAEPHLGRKVMPRIGQSEQLSVQAEPRWEVTPRRFKRSSNLKFEHLQHNIATADEFATNE